VIAWLRINGALTRLYYSDPAALPLLDAGAAKHATLQSIGTIRESTEGEASNVSVTVDVASRAHFQDPPVGSLAAIESDAGIQFAGTIKTVKVAIGGITLGIEQ
jgi:hypothetical protein